MTTRIETGKKVEPRPSLWRYGIAKGSVKAATATAAGQPAAAVRRPAELVEAGRAGLAVLEEQHDESPRRTRSSAAGTHIAWLRSFGIPSTRASETPLDPSSGVERVDRRTECVGRP